MSADAHIISQIYQALGAALGGATAGMIFAKSASADHAFKLAKREVTALRYKFRAINKTRTIRLGEPWNGEIVFTTTQES